MRGASSLFGGAPASFSAAGFSVAGFAADFAAGFAASFAAGFAAGADFAAGAVFKISSNLMIGGG